MAPDLNAVAAGGKWNYDAPGSTGYNIPNQTLNVPENRRLKVLTIGTGVSGILAAYQIQKNCKNVEHVIYEKNADLGGTWLENRYPGCACDIPSHAYTYNFALNPDWPQYFSYSPDIKAYLDRVVEVFDLRKYMTFNSEIVECRWHEDEGKWHVKIKQTHPGQSPKEFEETCDLLLHATGILNNYKWPEMPGLDKFKGKLIHTARWPKEYQAEQWKDDTVAVIGSGASSIQTVPTMINSGVKHMDVFVRTGIWFVEIVQNFGTNRAYTDEQKQNFKKKPESLVAHGKLLEDQVNGLWGSFYSDSPMQGFARKIFEDRMAEFIKDKRLLKGFTPNFGVGCRRITPGDPYMLAVQKENVDVHFTGVKSLTEDGVVGEDGIERKVDTVICATGFDVSYRPRFPLIGRGGVDLKDKWKICPEGYFGLAIPEIPNFITFVGPTWPVENGSVIGPLISVSEYAVQIIKKMQYENIHSWVPRQDATDKFNEHAQEWIKHTVWKDDCRSWYRNNDTGRVNAVWPGSSLHYIHSIQTPRYEDFDMRYHEKFNQYAYLGMGYTIETTFGPALARPDLDEAAANASGHTELSEAEKKKKEEEAYYVDGKPKPLDPLSGKQELDKSPYLNMQNLDVRWLVAVCGVELEKAKEMVIEAAAQEAARAKRWELEMELQGLGGSVERSLPSRHV